MSVRMLIAFCLVAFVSTVSAFRGADKPPALLQSLVSLQGEENPVAPFPSYFKDARTEYIAVEMARVEVYAGDYTMMFRNPLRSHPVKAFIDTFDESQAVMMATDTHGYLRLDLAVGTRVFFTSLGRNGFHETTTAIATVPKGGLTDTLTRIYLQVPSELIYYLFISVIPRHFAPDACRVVVTVGQYNTSYNTNTEVQGFDGVSVYVNPSTAAEGDHRPFYFDIFPNNKTNPLPNTRTTTSLDGGVAFSSVPVNPGADVTIGAFYKDFPFSSSVIRCLRPNQFINAAPNQGPRAQRKLF